MATAIPFDLAGQLVRVTEPSTFRSRESGELVPIAPKLQVLIEGGRNGAVQLLEVGTKPLNEAGVDWQAWNAGDQLRLVGTAVIGDRDGDRSYLRVDTAARLSDGDPVKAAAGNGRATA